MLRLPFLNFDLHQRGFLFAGRLEALADRLGRICRKMLLEKTRVTVFFQRTLTASGEVSLYLQLASCGQSYKYFTLVIYDSRVVIWGIFKSGMPLGS